MCPRLIVEREVDEEEHELLQAMAADAATNERTRKRAKAILAFLETGTTAAAAELSGASIGTVRKAIQRFNEEGWRGLITVQSPRGGDFLSHYDQGYWAERLARTYLDNSRDYRAVLYGTSRSEPFTDLQTFRDYAINEFLLQAWSSGQRWKRPDLLLLPRQLLRQQAGNDVWTPDLKHWDNEQCKPFVAQATAAIEVETSLWQVSRATVALSFTVKDEDIEALRAWVRANGIPLYVFQVFYDEAHVLPFSTLEFLIGAFAPPERRVVAEVDRTTRKSTYRIPLTEGFKLGGIPEPEVEGRVFKAPNGKVTIYGRLVGSCIGADDCGILELLASGKLLDTYEPD
jgi:hypothetical protein